MTFGERLSYVKKSKTLYQSDIGKMIGINGDAYGRYEHNEVKPTIEMATKISNTLKVSLYYLVVKTDLQLDSEVLNRIDEVSKMTNEDKGHVFSLFDAFIAKTKLKSLI